IEDDLALVHLDGVVLQLAFPTFAAPDAELRLVSHHDSLAAATAASYSASSSSVRYFSSSDRSNRRSRSGRIDGWILTSILTLEPAGSAGQPSRRRRHSGDIFGRSSRVWPPRLSSRISAARAMHSLTSSMLRRSRARCQL